MNNDMQAIIFYIVVSLLSVLLLYFWSIYRGDIAQKRIDKWLKDNKYRLLEKKFRLIFKGPFFKGSILFDMVYIISFLDESDHEKRCWIKIGNRFIGLFSKEFDVYWKRF